MGPLLFCALWGCAAASAPKAPFSAENGCSAPEYRALDFWLGEWEVRDRGGALEGTNRIVKELSGCAVRESWTDAAGGRGESTFYFDRAARRWKQVWVTDAGSWKEKIQVDGAAGALRFQGELPRPQGGTLVDRTTLTRLPGGGGLQLIEQSLDGGETWPVAWGGLYARPKTAPPPAGPEVSH